MPKLDPVHWIASVAPWLAPIPTAWLVYSRTLTHLHWPWPISLAAAITLECLGIAILATALEHWSYNRTRRKSDPPASIAIPIALVLAYILAAELLTVFLDAIGGPLLRWTPAIFPLLSVAAMTVLALRSEHARRLASITAGKAARSGARAAARRSRAAASQPQQLHCQLCDRTFATQQALNAHQRSHSREKRDRLAFTARTKASKPSTGSSGR